MPLTRADLLDRLSQLGIDTTTTDHPAVFTVGESEELHDQIPGGHSKNLFLKDKKDRVFLVTVLADATVDLKKIHTLIGAQGRVSFGKPDLLMELLGVEPGSVTPFGIVNDREGRVSVILDAALMAHDVVNFHPLENTATTSIASQDMVRFLTEEGHPPKILAVTDEAIAAGL
ncbi:prolyl-tRNA synthetase associated domain-containing protein [Amorphus orientalis]|uniref:Ala-tRNA(Pro) deacylase n=1 Tax=Amorphus orientalis TaxID=649198 RepID=A0AAE3VRY2_9HYPH|nr:YbaK/EbsC family protein [Amorphus orientalis]MDQ0317077.1 Ala-tRNA(Pro) deacylase [Amorphus orientalis]